MSKTKTAEKTSRAGEMVKITKTGLHPSAPHRRPGSRLRVEAKDGRTYQATVIASLKTFHDAPEGKCNITTTALLEQPLERD